MGSEEGIRWRGKPDGLAPIETRRSSRGIDEEAVARFGVDGEPVSPAGRMFHEPNFNIHIVAIMGSKNKIIPEIIKANLPNTLLKHPRFTSLLVVDEKEGGKMKWVRTEVDVAKHIIVPEIEQSALQNPDKFVEDYIQNLTKSSIERSKPLWEIHLLNLKTSDAEGVGVFRIHHSLGDGTSLMSLLLACARQVAHPDALPTLPARRCGGGGGGGGGERGFIRSASAQCLRGFWWVVQLLWNTVVDVALFTATSWFLKDTETPILSPVDSVMNPRRIVHRMVSLDDMKLIKNAMNLTINDVAFGITQAGLTKYLNRRYGEINNDDKGETKDQNNLPKDIRVRSVLLINIRQSAGIQELADMMEKDTKAKWGNWVGYILLPFDISFNDDPLDYIRKAKAIIDRKKHSLEVICTSAIADLILKLFGIKRASNKSHRIFMNTSLVFSNLVGPLEEIGWYGHELAYLAPSSYGQPHALMINFQSYMNKMAVVLAVDETVIPDAHQLCDDIAEALELVKDAVIEKGLA